MAMVVAYEDAKANLLKRNNPEIRGEKVSFFEFRDQPDLPHASLNGHEPGKYFSGTHFHVHDQFQVMTDGKCRIGRHALTPYCIHFTRAYTPYGPLVSDGDAFTFMVMRSHRDAGAQFLPEKQALLQQVPDRQPWQISRAVTFPATQPTANVALQAVPGIVDEHGLAAYTLSMGPHARTLAPDPTLGDGQYLVVVKGSLWHDDKEQKALTLIFVKPHEGAFQLHAGAQGLQALVLNFPAPVPRVARTPAPSAGAGFRKWQCELCAFSYDEAQGLPDEGIAAGTRWEDVPDSWSCPDCSVSKSEFRMVIV